MRKEGRSYRQIGEWLGVHHQTIKRWVEEFSGVAHETPEKTTGDDGKQYAPTKSTESAIDQRRQRVAELREQGAKISDIAEQVGASVGTVHNDIKAIKKAEEEEREKEHEIPSTGEKRSTLNDKETCLRIHISDFILLQRAGLSRQANNSERSLRRRNYLPEKIFEMLSLPCR